jgi:diguanylate cyclase (GGDEF)-like protein
MILGSRMDLYALDEEVARLEAALALVEGQDRLPVLLPLAWSLRQRQSVRALALADEALGLLVLLVGEEEVSRQRARLDLVEAEVAVLQGRYDDGRAKLQRAKAAFGQLADPIGLGDTALAAYLLHQICGAIEPALVSANEALAHYAAGGDAVRARAAAGWRLLLIAYGDADAAEQGLDALAALPASAIASSVDPRGDAAEHPAVAAIFLATRSVIHGARNESAQAMLCAARSSHHAEAAGLVRQAIAAANNAGWHLQELGDFDAAAEWMDREYIAARATGWPTVLAFSTTRLGELLRHMGQFDRSREVLQEAIMLYDQIPAGINKGVAYRVFGKTLLALDRPEEALAAYETATAIFRAENYHERLSNALIGAARSLSLADRPVEALERIEDARSVATGHRIRTAEIELARASAEIYGRHRLPPPSGMAAPTVVLHYLEQALAIGTAIEGWQVPVDLLVELSTGWEAVGDGVRALGYLKQAMAAERREGHRTATNRTLALHIRHETEQARLELQHSRELMRAEAERATALEAALNDLRAAQAELEMRRAEFERLSLLDPMTGIGNRRHFNDRAQAEIDRARRDDASLGVVLFDIDHFKRVNDRFGHAVGDIVIQRVVEAARGLLRPGDFIARLGGEEFVLLIPGADIGALYFVAERARDAIAATAIEIGASDRREWVRITASFGLSVVGAGDASIEPVVARADAALYCAKHQGRNRVFGEDPMASFIIPTNSVPAEN